MIQMTNDHRFSKDSLENSIEIYSRKKNLKSLSILYLRKKRSTNFFIVNFFFNQMISLKPSSEDA